MLSVLFWNRFYPSAITHERKRVFVLRKPWICKARFFSFCISRSNPEAAGLLLKQIKSMLFDLDTYQEFYVGTEEGRRRGTTENSKLALPWYQTALSTPEGKNLLRFSILVNIYRFFFSCFWTSIRKAIGVVRYRALKENNGICKEKGKGSVDL